MAGAGPSRAARSLGFDEADLPGGVGDVSRELQALLTGDVGKEIVTAIESIMAKDISTDARRELEEHFRKNPELASALVAAIGPDVPEAMIEERGWPTLAFSKCKCSSNCIRRWVAADSGRALDEHLSVLKAAAAAEKALEESGSGPLAVLQRSVWSQANSSRGVTSSVLEALNAAEALLPATPATGKQSKPATPLQRARVEINEALEKVGLCLDARSGVTGASRTFLYGARKDGSRVTVGSRGKSRLPANLAILGDRCKERCAAQERGAIRRRFDSGFGVRGGGWGVSGAGARREVAGCVPGRARGERCAGFGSEFAALVITTSRVPSVLHTHTVKT